MAQLLSEAAAGGMMPDYIGKLLAAFQTEAQSGLAGRQARPGKSKDKPDLPSLSDVTTVTPYRAIEPT